MSKKTCSVCKQEINEKSEKVYFIAKNLKSSMHEMDIHDSTLEELDDNEFLCWKCGNKVYSKHAVEVYNYNKEKLLPEEFEELILKRIGEDWIAIAQAELGIDSQGSSLKSDVNYTQQSFTESSEKELKITTIEEIKRIVALYHDKFKREWDKNAVIQFKNDSIAILQRVYGSQVQFIVAFDRLTKEGYRLVAQDEGKTGGQASGGFTGGVNSYYYFQRMEFVR